MVVANFGCSFNKKGVFSCQLGIAAISKLDFHSTVTLSNLQHQKKRKSCDVKVPLTPAFFK